MLKWLHPKYKIFRRIIENTNNLIAFTPILDKRRRVVEFSIADVYRVIPVGMAFGSKNYEIWCIYLHGETDKTERTGEHLFLFVSKVGALEAVTLQKRLGHFNSLNLIVFGQWCMQADK